MRMRVLILRSPELSDRLINLLESDGVDFACLPVTRTEFIHPGFIPINKFSTIAFTSSNGVRGLFRALESSAHILPLNTRLAAVGKATADTIHELFSRNADIVAENASGASLAHLLCQELPAGTEILYPCPGGHNPEFADRCRAFGLNVHPLPVYRTVEVDPDTIRLALSASVEPDAVIFYAPSAVNAFQKALPAPWPFRAIAIGQTTERALHDAGQAVVVRSESTEPHSIVLAIHGIHSMEWETQNA